MKVSRERIATIAAACEWRRWWIGPVVGVVDGRGNVRCLEHVTESPFNVDIDADNSAHNHNTCDTSSCVRDITLVAISLLKSGASVVVDGIVREIE